jgi:hypothetical protein
MPGVNHTTTSLRASIHECARRACDPTNDEWHVDRCYFRPELMALIAAADLEEVGQPALLAS